jgi:hypothetical protein
MAAHSSSTRSVFRPSSTGEPCGATTTRSTGPLGFTLDGEVTQTWAFQAATGRFSAVTTASSAQTAQTYTWGYNSGGLVSSLTDGGSFSVNYDYEANRDLLKLIDSTWNSESRTRYDYTYNSLGQRQTARQSGHATNGAFADFGNATTYNYTYNERGELTSAADYLGLDATNPSSQLPGRNFAYDFDPAGNRKTASRTGTAGAADAFGVDSLNQSRVGRTTSRTRPAPHRPAARYPSPAARLSRVSDGRAGTGTPR